MNSLKGIILIGSGSTGLWIAKIQPWMEHLEWSARMLLLVVSIVSMVVGLYFTCRKKGEKPPGGDV